MHQKDGREDLVRNCNICNKILSQYNYNKYCFSHTIEGLEIEEKVIDDNIVKSNLKGKKKWNAKYYAKKIHLSNMSNTTETREMCENVGEL